MCKAVIQSKALGIAVLILGGVLSACGGLGRNAHSSASASSLKVEAEALSALSVSVKDSAYGAKGDGVTNDTAAIQKAISAVAGTGGKVTVPAGTYMVNPAANNGVGLRMGSDMTLSFDSGAILQALPTSTPNYIVLLVSGVKNVNILGGTIVGNRYSNSITSIVEGGNGLQVVGSQSVVVTGLTTKNCWADGIYVGAISQNVALNNVVSSGNRRAGMSVTSVDGLVVKGCTFMNSSGLMENGTLVCGLGVNLEPNPGGTVNNVQFTGCIFTANAAEGLGFGPSVANRGKAFVTNIVADGNTAMGNGLRLGGAPGISVSNTSGHKVRNNVVKNNLGCGILLRNHANGILVTGNTVTGSTAAAKTGNVGYGILVYDSAGSTVTGNTITSNAGCGIRDAYPSDPASPNTIAPNTLSNNNPDTCK